MPKLLSLKSCSRNLLLSSISMLCVSLHASTPWQQPTEEELKMTTLPQVPGSSAVVLYHEEIVDDPDQSWAYYYRIKILTEKGRDDFSSVTIQYPDRSEGGYSINSVAGRTIHADGTVIPFTGKPFDRELFRSKYGSIREKVMALPDIQVGSIIEYRYKLRRRNDWMGGNYTFIPTWYTQSRHFERKEHFLWNSTLDRVVWTSTLPKGSSGIQSNKNKISLDLADVMPTPDEPNMLPPSYFGGQVHFFQVAYDIHSPEEFWKVRGDAWSQGINDFIGQPSSLAAEVARMTAGAATQDEKLRKIYAAVQKLQNTDFERQHSASEEKRNGETQPKSVADVLKHARGNDLDLTYLFVGLARAAGLKAYVMAVTNRDKSSFNEVLLSLRQLDDDVAIVEIDGKERFFDPAVPFCPYGQLLWTHNGTGGLRQNATGTAIAVSQRPDYRENVTLRTGTLTLAPDGQATGTLAVTFTGARAISFRQITVFEDQEALHKKLEAYLRDDLPSTAEVTFRSIENLMEAEHPLVVHFNITLPLASRVGKRLLLPSQVFHNEAASLFTSPTRTTPIYFIYPEALTERITVGLPQDMQVESHPADETQSLPSIAIYKSSASVSKEGLFLQRSYAEAGIVIPVSEYAALRDFLTRVNALDRVPVVIQMGSTAGSTGK